MARTAGEGVGADRIYADSWLLTPRMAPLFHSRVLN
jgi:hypothetical protein